MNNLAVAYFALGRHQDALELQEKTLKFRSRVLPENHPDIGISYLNLSYSYRQAGDFNRAIERAREALRIFQAALPPTHPHVEQAQKLIHHLEGSNAARRA